VCEPSQNGLFADCPQRHSAITSLSGVSRDGDDPNGSTGWEWIAQQTARSVAHAGNILASAGATVLTRRDVLQACRRSRSPVSRWAAAATLEARGIVLRWVPQPRALRVFQR